MRIFKHRSFHQCAKSEGLADSALKKAVEEMRKDFMKEISEVGYTRKG